MKFTKMHGAGNDYVFVNCFDEPIPADPPALAKAISDRHFGVGGDGLVLICPSAEADAEMRMYNADGSYSENCGNALRCIAKFAYERGIARVNPLRVATGGRLLTTSLVLRDDVVEKVQIEMGEPVLQASQIPTLLPGDPPVEVELQVAGRALRVTCVSMGNPHCVVHLDADELNDATVLGLGPQIETHAMFPRRVNVEFVHVVNPRLVRQRTWERGSGETLACGTGACAVCVAGVLTGKSAREVTVQLLGGELEVAWRETDNRVVLTGPATEVFSGEWPGVA